MRLRRISILLGAGAVVLLAISGCGDGGDTTGEAQPTGFTALNLTMEGKPDSENVGLVTADYLGQFREAGIGLTVGTPLNPERPIGYAAKGLADVVVSYQPQVVLAQEEGLPVVAFGSLVSQTTMAMIWLPDSGIDDIADLKGKTIAIPGVPFQRDFLEAILAQSGLSLDEVKVVVGGNELVTLLKEKEVDAAFGGSGNAEGAALEELGLNPVVTPVTELGVPDYDELVFVTQRDRLARHPDLYRRLIEVAAKGTRTAVEDPGVGKKALASQYAGVTPPPGIQAGVEATLPLLSEDGQIDPTQTAELIAWMHDEGMIRRELPVSAVLFEAEE